MSSSDTSESEMEKKQHDDDEEFKTFDFLPKRQQQLFAVQHGLVKKDTTK